VGSVTTLAGNTEHERGNLRQTMRQLESVPIGLFSGFLPSFLMILLGKLRLSDLLSLPHVL
jgi:hypothetical protein